MGSNNCGNSDSRNNSIFGEKIVAANIENEAVESIDSPITGNRSKAARELLIYDSEEHKINIIGEGGYLRYKGKIYIRESYPQYLTLPKYSMIGKANLYWWQLPEEGYKDKRVKVALEYNNEMFYHRVLIIKENGEKSTYFRNPMKE